MPGNPLTDPNWANDVTDQITTFIGKVRDTTTNKAIVVVRGVVYGLMGLLLGFVAIVLLLIFLTRGLQSALDVWTAPEKAVWISYLAIGGIFTGAGLFLMRKKYTTD